LALDGEHFFYINPLLSQGGYAREPWYRVACCPPNLMRLLASLAQYFVTDDDTGLQIHMYNTAMIHASLASGRPLAVSMQTDYPWQGQVRLVVQDTDGSTWTLRLRQPDWCSDATVALNGQPVENPIIESGYMALKRAWQPGDVVELTLAMEPALIEAHPRVDAVRDCVAIQRGPLVYCLEGIDYPGINLMDIRLNETAPLRAVWRDDVMADGFMAIQASGYALENNEEWQSHLYRRLGSGDGVSRKPVLLTAIPYYAWANRGANAMRVWIPRAAP
jgi:DUF1680 family protein